MKNLINILMVCALLPTAFYGHAQNIKNIEKCAQTENDLLRLMCYDELFPVSVSGKVSINNQVSDSNEQGVSSTLEEAVKTAPAPQVSHTGVAATAAAVATLGNRVTNEVIASEAAPLVEERSAVDLFGAEDLAQQEDPQTLSKIESVIDALSENKRDIRTFTLANGQVWRETETSRLRLKVGMPIFIEKGALSSHFLGKESSNRRIRVKRVK